MDFAILVGVSSGGDHVIVLRRTRVLLAVNPDPATPVFQRVDVGIVGDGPTCCPVLPTGWRHPSGTGPSFRGNLRGPLRRR